MSSIPADGHEQQQAAPPTTFDIFIQNVDLRWCLLLCCDYSSMKNLRQTSSAFVTDVPIALSSEAWSAIPANTMALCAAQWEACGDEVLHKPLVTLVGQSIVRLQCDDEDAREAALALGAQLDDEGDPVIALRHPIGVEAMLNAAQDWWELRAS